MWKSVVALALVACGSKSPKPVDNVAPAADPASPVGGWKAAGLFICVVPGALGFDEERPPESACRCSWAAEGEGHCRGQGMHSSFDFTWKIESDSLVLSQTSDMGPSAVTAKRDPTMKCPTAQCDQHRDEE